MLIRERNRVLSYHSMQAAAGESECSSSMCRSSGGWSRQGSFQPSANIITATSSLFVGHFEMVCCAEHVGAYAELLFCEGIASYVYHLFTTSSAELCNHFDGNWHMLMGPVVLEVQHDWAR